MPASKKKRSSFDTSDSDDCDSDNNSNSDDDDDFLTSVFGTRKSVKQKNARDEEARKKKRMAEMNALLDNVRVKSELENRMDELRQENNELLRKASLAKEKEDKIMNEMRSKTKDNLALSRDNHPIRHQEKRKIGQHENDQTRDTNATSCLGSRSTLQLSRVVFLSRTNETPTPGLDSTAKPRGLTPLWSGLEEALTDLRSILLADRHQEDGSSAFIPLREELLQSRTTKSTRACSEYLRKRLMCQQEDQERIRRIPVNVLRWLMTLACAPRVTGTIGSGESNKRNKTEITNQTKNTKQAASGNGGSLRFFVEAQTGAYQTLRRLWSQELGFPLQQQQQTETYLFSVSALPKQLNQWFGLSLPSETLRANSAKNDDGESSLFAPQDAKLETQNNKDPRRVSNTRTTLVRFLQLWALGLQKQINIENDVRIVQFRYDKGDRARFRNDVSDAIISVLWAGLDPLFASSRSAKDDGNRSILTMISCLLDMVAREETCNNNGNNSADDKETFGQWLLELSERIYKTWSEQLGRGQKGTDAYEDKHAWLCLGRTVARLVEVEDKVHERNGFSHDLTGVDRREKMAPSPMKAFRLCLCRCILKHAFRDAEDASSQHTGGKTVKNENYEGIPNDWVSHSVDEEMERLKVPAKLRSSHCWQATILVLVGLAKLASSFPADEASKCYALMEIFTACFRSDIIELQQEILNNCQRRKDRGFDESRDVRITNDTSINITTNVVEDEVLEQYVLHSVFVQLENCSQIISGKTRVLIMRNVCFPWASRMAESLRNYALSQKERFAHSSIKNGFEPAKQQSKISTFFVKEKPSDLIVTK